MALAAALVGHYRTAVDSDRDTYLPDLAGSVHNLALCLAEAGRRGEGLTAAPEASSLYDELARSEPDLFGARANNAARLVAELDDEP